MSATQPDRTTVLSAIELATRAPSVHNTQPWRWQLGDHTVHLYADWDRQVRATDPDGRDLVVSCGAALHHLRVALRASGWHTTVHRVPNPAYPAHLASIEVRRHAPTDDDVLLSGTILRRRSDRRPLSSWPVPSSHIDRMIAAAAKAGALLVPVSDPVTRAKLIAAIAEAARQQESDRDYALEIASWSGRGPFAIDGVLAASSPAKASTHSRIPMRTFPGGTLPAYLGDDGADEATVLLALATAGDDTISQLRAGEAASAALLAATELGLATCPLSQALEVADTRQAVATDVLEDAAMPQLLIRVGWAPTTASRLPSSPRRPLADVVSELGSDERNGHH
ncbi:MAG: NAD(P)H nitroreductase [Actinophytocola sp.]|nr:NAD(P)H nitroreductase [Actinophytocola sp.]